MKIVVFANGRVGYRITQYLCENAEIVGLVVHRDSDWKEILMRSVQCDVKFAPEIPDVEAEMGVSLFYDHIFRKKDMEIFPKGIINLHSGYLPYNRGAHPNIWSIIDNTPAGVTLHYVDEGIDTGDIIARKKVDRSLWETAGSLYNKLQDASIDLFRDTWPMIKEGIAERIPQSGPGTYHTTRDIERIKKLDIRGHEDFFRKIMGLSHENYNNLYMEANGSKVFLEMKVNNEQ